jgi:hypothetical protein
VGHDNLGVLAKTRGMGPHCCFFALAQQFVFDPGADFCEGRDLRGAVFVGPDQVGPVARGNRSAPAVRGGVDGLGGKLRSVLTADGSLAGERDLMVRRRLVTDPAGCPG